MRTARQSRHYSLPNTVVDGLGKVLELNARSICATLRDSLNLLEITVEKPQDWVTPHATPAAPMSEQY